MSLPNDDNILLSLINTALRDGDPLADFCARYDADSGELFARLERAGYKFEEENNCFKRV